MVLQGREDGWKAVDGCSGSCGLTTTVGGCCCVVWRLSEEETRQRGVRLTACKAEFDAVVAVGAKGLASRRGGGSCFGY
jgi:hypothetical protein